MAGARVPLRLSKPPARLGLASGNGMSVTMCGAGGEAGDPIRDGGVGLRSGRETFGSSALVLAMVVEAEGVSDAGVSDAGGVPKSRIPAVVSGSDAVSGVAEGAGETPAVSCGSGGGGGGPPRFAAGKD